MNNAADQNYESILITGAISYNDISNQIIKLYWIAIKRFTNEISCLEYSFANKIRIKLDELDEILEETAKSINQGGGGEGAVAGGHLHQ